MKKIKCVFLAVLALVCLVVSANAQDAKEVRKQELAKKMKTHKTFEAKPDLAKKAAVTNDQVTLKVKPSNKPAIKGERKERPNATKKVEPIKVTTTVKKKSGVKVAKERPAYDFSAKRQQVKAKRAARISNVKFDREAIQQKIRERKSNQ